VVWQLAQAFFERAAMPVTVASRAGITLHALITHRPARRVGFVAFFASHFDVQSRQRVRCLRMVGVLRRFPLWRFVHSLPSWPLCGSLWHGVQFVDCPKNDLFTSFILISSRLAGSMCATVCFPLRSCATSLWHSKHLCVGVLAPNWWQELHCEVPFSDACALQEARARFAL
jgi:hypothetical protein